MVFCPPLGAEEECTHRTLLHVADALAHRSMVALRFDFPGTGDSEGERALDLRLGDWVAAVEAAADFLRRQTGCTDVALIGVRLGAAVAATAAARAGASVLALWAPVGNGRAYARELRAVAALGNSHAQTVSQLEVAGHLYPADFVDAVSALRAQDWDLKGVRRALLLERDDVPPDQKLRDALRDSGIELDFRGFSGYSAMFDRPHDAELPTAAMADLCDWMVARSGEVRAAPRGGASSTPSQGSEGGEVELRTSDFRERHLTLAADRRLTGVLCEPSGEHAIAPLLLLLNAGSVHHTGPGRLYTRLARELARSGIPSLRVNLSMLGDAIVPGVVEENDCYAAACREDVLALMDDVRGRLGFRDMILSGLCSGAYWALQVALDPRAQGLRAVAMINPLVIGHRPQGGRSTGREAAQALRYRQSMRSWAKWKKVFTLRAETGAALAVLARRAASVIAAGSRELARRFGLAAPNAVGMGLRSLRIRGVVVGLFVGATEPGYVLLRQEAPREVAEGLRTSAIRLYSMADCDHTFTDEAAKQRLFLAFRTFVSDLRPS